jgi:hypothetical protein
MKTMLNVICLAGFLVLSACSNNLNSSGSSTNLSGNYTGMTTVKILDSSGKQTDTGDLSVTLQVVDAAGSPNTSLKKVVWKNQDVSPYNTLFSVQGSKLGTEVAFVLNLGPGCTNPVLQGEAFFDRLEIQTGSLAYQCPFRLTGTVSWNAFTFNKL